MNTDPTTAAYVAAARFFALAECAARHGGFWVSAGGGTARVVAGEIARKTGLAFNDAYRALCAVGRDQIGEDWYQSLADWQPFRWDQEFDAFRWDARTVARAACRLP